MFSSFRDLPFLRSISNTFGPFRDDLTSRSCASNHAAKVSLGIIIG